MAGVGKYPETNSRALSDCPPRVCLENSRAVLASLLRPSVPRRAAEPPHDQSPTFEGQQTLAL